MSTAVKSKFLKKCKSVCVQCKRDLPPSAAPYVCGERCLGNWRKAVEARGDDPGKTTIGESDEFKRHVLYMANQEWPDDVPDDVYRMVQDLLFAGTRKQQAERNKYKHVLHPRLVETAAAQPKDRKQTVEEMAALIMAKAAVDIEYKKMTGFLDDPED